MEQVRRRVTDKRVLALIRKFLAAGVMSELGTVTATPSGTPQGGLCAAAHKPPYEQRWVMRSAGLKFPQRAGLTAERCA
jgi:hypothetical protein